MQFVDQLSKVKGIIIRRSRKKRITFRLMASDVSLSTIFNPYAAASNLMCSCGVQSSKRLAVSSLSSVSHLRRTALTKRRLCLRTLCHSREKPDQSMPSADF